MNRQLSVLDVHFEIRPNTPREWVERSFHGLKQAIERVEYPIYIYIVRGLPGFTGTMCGGGYTCGTALYATHTAVEEYILPDVFVELGRTLFSTNRTYSLSEVIVPEGKMVRNLTLDLLVVRRDLLLDRHHSYATPYYGNHVVRNILPNLPSHQL